MGHEATVKRNARPIPVQTVKEKSPDKFSLVRFLCWIMAGDSPTSVNRLKKAMITVATAITPKSSGEIRRANTPATTSDTSMPLYLARAV